MEVYEKAIRIARWWLGFIALRELLAQAQRLWQRNSSADGI